MIEALFTRVADLKYGAFVTALMVSSIAYAYPDYIAKGYTNCSTCHYSPTGGGLANSYGTASQEALWPDILGSDSIARVRQKADVTGYDDTGAAQFQWGFGADSRFMFTTLPSSEDAKTGFSFFPMLIEVGGQVAYGKLLAYGSIAPKVPEADSIGWKALSREHWLQYRATDAFSVRAGRMVLPFGLKVPDHTAYTRTGLGFGYYDQSYAAEADYISERLAVSIAGFLGDPQEDPARLRERGAAASVTYNIDGRGALGVSGYFGSSDLVQRGMGAVFARLRLVGASYLLAELDLQRRSPEGDDGSTSWASLERLGWFVLESLDVYLEHGWRTEAAIASSSAAFTQNRYIAGASWWVLPWLEVAPQIRLESSPSSNSYTGGFLQLHLYY